jgi:glycine/D-amino acid oxidase-like deaminating enzyme
MATTALQGAPCSTARATRRHVAYSSPKSHNGLRLAAKQQRQQGAAERRAQLRVQAAQAAPPQQTGAGSGSAGAGDEGSVYDVVVVGAGISGLTTAQVRACCFAAPCPWPLEWPCVLQREVYT